MERNLPSLPEIDGDIDSSFESCKNYLTFLAQEVESLPTSETTNDIDPVSCSERCKLLGEYLATLESYLDDIEDSAGINDDFDASLSPKMTEDHIDNSAVLLKQYRSQVGDIEGELCIKLKKYADILKNQGNDLFKNGKYEDALAKYDLACNIDPDDPIYFTNKALALQKLERWIESIENANNAIIIDESYLKGYIIRTKSYLAMNNINDAAKSLEEIPDSYESQHDVIELTQAFSVKAKDTGNVYFKEGNYHQALSLYSLAIQFDDQNHLYYSNRSACYQAKRQWKEAKEDALQVIELNPLFSKGYVHLIRCQIQLGEYDQALTTLSDANAALSQLPDWSTIKSQFDELSRSISSAKASANARSSANDKARGEALKTRGNQLYQSGEYQDAIRLYSQAISAYPDEGTYYGNRAACWMMLKEYQQAVNDCNQGLTLEKQPGDLDKLRLRLIDALTQKGKISEAADFIQEYNNKRKGEGETWFANSSQFQEKIQTLEFIKQNIANAKIALDKGEFSRAKRLIELVQQKGVSEHIELLVCLAKAHLGLRELEDAAKISQEAITIFGTKGGVKSVEAYTVRGEALAMQGLTEQACKYYSVAVQLDPDNQTAIQRLKALRKVLSETIEVRKRIGEAMAERKYEIAIAACTDGLSIDKHCLKLMAEMHYKRSQAYQMLGKLQARTPTSSSTSTSSSSASASTESPHIASFRKCLQDANSAIYYDKSMIEAFYLKIEALQTLNRHDEAVSELEQLVQEKPYRRDETAHEKLKHAKLLLKRSKRKDLYAVLMVDKGSLASEEDIRKAYKKSALKWHPDRHSSATEEKKKEAEVRFKEIQSAFELLTDPQKRRLYDQGYDEEEIEQKLEMEKQYQSYGRGGHYGHFH